MSAETVKTEAAKQGTLAARLDRTFHFTERGSSMKNEILAGMGAFFIAVCALLMNTRIIGAAYGSYAGSYLAVTLLAFAGTLILGIVCNLPLVQTANMALSTAVISMLSAGEGLTYANLLAVTFIAALVYLAVVLTPAKRFFVEALPAGVRKALPVGVGLYTVGVALQNAGILGADGGLVHASELRALPAFYFWIAAAATVVYILFRAFKVKRPLTKLFGLMVVVMWVCGIVFYMDAFMGGQTAAIIVYQRLNLIFATDGAQPYNIGHALASLNVGTLFSEGFDFSAFTAAGGSVFLLFVKGILTFLILGLYTNLGSVDAAAVTGGYETSPDAERKALVTGAALNVAAPILGAAPTSIGTQSSVGTHDGAKTGLASVTAAVGFFIALFTWLFFMVFATGTNGVGMWIDDTEVKLAAYVQDAFAFADVIMVIAGAAMLRGIKKLDAENLAELIPFIATVAGIAFTRDIAIGVAVGVIAYVILRLADRDRKTLGIEAIVLAVILLVTSIFTLSGSVSAGTKSGGSGASGGALSEVTDFKLDFDTGEYSFTGAKNASFYYVRLFSVKDGAESVSAETQSDRIDATSENTYSGRLDYNFVAGDYNAYVLAVASGYTPSTTLCSGTSTSLGTPAVSATWREEGPNVTVQISITPGDNVSDSFAVAVADGSGTEVYANGSVPAGDLTLAARDLGAEALSKDDKYTVTVAVNDVPGYAAPAPVSTDVTEQQQMGPGGGGGGGDWTVKPEATAFPEGAESFEFVIGEHDYFHTTANLADPVDGTAYVYQLAKGDPGAPFDADMFLYLNEDGTAKVTVSAEGPISASSVDGTWTASGGEITVTF